MENYGKNQTLSELISEVKRIHQEKINQLNDLILEQKQVIQKYEKEMAHVQKLKYEFTQKLSEEYWAPRKNERNAGRKPALSAELVHDIKQLRSKGKTYRQIAAAMKLSVGTVYKGASMNLDA